MVYIHYYYTLNKKNKKMKKLLLITLVLSIFSCTNKESDACTELKIQKYYYPTIWKIIDLLGKSLFLREILMY